MRKMNEEKFHLVVSIILGVLVTLTVIGAVIAVRERLSRAGAPLDPSSESPVSDSLSSEASPSGNGASSGLPAVSEYEPPPMEEGAASFWEDTSSIPQESGTVSGDASSQEDSSAEEESPGYEGQYPGVSVDLFADGQTLSLSGKQVDEFMDLYLLVDLEYVRTEDNSDLNAVSTGGFAVTYPDGRREFYFVGELYDGTWWSGDDFYEVDGNALALEEYMYQFPIIYHWINRAHAAGLILS